MQTYKTVAKTEIPVNLSLRKLTFSRTTAQWPKSWNWQPWYSTIFWSRDEHPFSVKGQRMNVFGVVRSKVSVTTAHSRRSARTAVDDTDMNRNGCVPKTWIIEIGDQLALVFQSVKSKTFFQNVSVFLLISFLGPRVNPRSHVTCPHVCSTFYLEQFLSLLLYLVTLKLLKHIGQLFCRFYVNLGFSDSSSWLYLDCTFLLKITEMKLWPSLCTTSGNRLFIYPIIGDADIGHLDGMLSARFFHCTLILFLFSI